MNKKLTLSVSFFILFNEALISCAFLGNILMKRQVQTITILGTTTQKQEGIFRKIRLDLMEGWTGT